LTSFDLFLTSREISTISVEHQRIHGARGDGDLEKDVVGEVF
jgi:hypothetical protein